MLESNGYFPREHRLACPEDGFPVFALPGSFEIVQKLNFADRPEGSSRLTGLPETRISRWSYTLVPWED